MNLNLKLADVAHQRCMGINPESLTTSVLVLVKLVPPRRQDLCKRKTFTMLNGSDTRNGLAHQSSSSSGQLEKNGSITSWNSFITPCK